MRHPAFFFALMGLLLALVTACAGGQSAPPFRLTAQSGEEVALEELRGRAVALTFLYTQCPEACPLLISRLQIALTSLGEAARQVVPVVVTVDPERDTVPVLREFASGFPGWLFLTATPGQLRNTWDNYGIFVRKEPPPPEHASHMSYAVTHTLKVVLIDQEGYIRGELKGEWTPAQGAEKLKALVAGRRLPGAFDPVGAVVAFLYRCGAIAIRTVAALLGHTVLMATIPIFIAIALFLLWRR